jgi:hypothetical protein
MIVNLQERVIDAPADVVGQLVDGFLDPATSIWPAPPWFPIQLDQGLAVGSRGGHGPIRYEVVGYRPGSWVRFRFDPRIGIEGYHELIVREVAGGTELRHLIVAKTHGQMRWRWPLVVRWLHEAVLQDLLDNAERAATGAVRRPYRWTAYVRLLRRVLGREKLTGQPTVSSQSRT